VDSRHPSAAAADSAAERATNSRLFKGFSGL
jgi:hypothetical protein